jgi:hypothetical protein
MLRGGAAGEPVIVVRGPGLIRVERAFRPAFRDARNSRASAAEVSDLSG